MQHRRPLSHAVRHSGRSGDIALIATAISGGAALCEDCIAKKTGVPLTEVSAALALIAKTFQLADGQGRCRACLEPKPAFSLTERAARSK